MLAPGLREFHWEDLVNLHVDLCFCRHRFIQTINEKVAAHKRVGIEELDQLAQVDEALKAAAESLEQAKSILFNACYGTAPESDWP